MRKMGGTGGGNSGNIVFFLHCAVGLLPTPLCNPPTNGIKSTIFFIPTCKVCVTHGGGGDYNRS